MLQSSNKCTASTWRAPCTRPGERAAHAARRYANCTRSPGAREAMCSSRGGGLTSTGTTGRPATGLRSRGTTDGVSAAARSAAARSGVRASRTGGSASSKESTLLPRSPPDAVHRDLPATQWSRRTVGGQQRSGDASGVGTARPRVRRARASDDEALRRASALTV
jgi:hypothetical protein